MSVPGDVVRDRSSFRRRWPLATPPRVLLGRTLLYSACGMVVLRGLVSFFPEAPVPSALERLTPGAEAEGSSDQAAMAFAARFVLDYLTYDDTDPAGRARRLAPYLAPGVDAASWSVAGRQSVGSVVPASVEHRGGGLALVTVAAAVGEGRWLHLAVPIRADEKGALAVVASPTLVPGPSRAELPMGDRSSEPAGDARAAAVVTPMLEAFFSAYGGRGDGDSSALDYYLAPGHSLSDLRGTVGFQGLSDVWVSPGPGERVARARVTWRTEGGTLTQLYRISLVEDRGRFYVSELGPALPQSSSSSQSERKEPGHDR